MNIVVGLGAEACTGILPGWLPDGHRMPADQHDLWVWLHASGPDAVFDVAPDAAGALAGLATVAAEQPAFTYRASLDLTGFEDGRPGRSATCAPSASGPRPPTTSCPTTSAPSGPASPGS